MALAGTLGSNLLTSRGQPGLSALAFLVSLLAMVAAAYCSYRGLKAWRGI